MSSLKKLCTLLFVACSYVLVECRSYNNGLIFYNLENRNNYLPPTISVSRGRGLSKFKYSPRGSIWSTFGQPCNCRGPLCGCCVGIKVKQYNFDQKMCANVTYARPKDEIQLEVFLNDTATAKYGISARNPSPLCVPIMMGIPMSMCIQMSNIGVQGDNLNMCMDFLVRLASTELFEMHFQCIKVGLQGAGWVGADGQPVIPANEGKLKDKNTNESDEYYDESEAEEENEIISGEKVEENIGMMSVQKDDLNKAEEEMDYNDITEKLMDIVKEKEQEAVKETKNQTISPLQDNKQVEEIVTNIMNSINDGNAAEEVSGIVEMPVDEAANTNQIKSNEELDNTGSSEEIKFSVVAEGSPVENERQNIDKNDLANLRNHTNEESKDTIEVINETKEDTLEMNLESIKQEETAEDDVEKNNEILESSANNVFDDEGLSESSPVKEMQMENNVETDDLHIKLADKLESGKIKQPITVIKENTTENSSVDQEYAAIENSEMFINANGGAEINNTDNELNNSLEMLQQTMGTSSEHLMETNLQATIPQVAETTSETGNVNNIDNHLTTAAIMTTTTTTTTSSTTNEPIKSNEYSAVAEMFIKNTDGVDKNHNADDDDNDVQDEDNENSDSDDDNSYENDSDYEDEESEETDDDTKEKVITSNNATANIMTNAAELNNINKTKHKESATTVELSNESHSNESHSNEESNETTNDEFETEEEEFEESADEKVREESNEQHENDTEEEFDGDFEDYDTAIKTITLNNKNDKTVNSDNNTCCKPAISFVFNNTHASNTLQKFDDKNKNAEIPQIDTASSNNLKFVSHGNSMISNTDDVNTLNVTLTANKISQIIAGSAATAISATPTATATTISNSKVMPLPMARKLYSLHHQQQQHYRRGRQHHQH